MKEKALLIGNGINNIGQAYSWSDLIENLIETIGAKGQIDTDSKPFPLLYEEIFVEAVRNRNFKEKRIKEYIAGEITKLKPNEIHQAITKLGIKNILTTNYDFTLEQSHTTGNINLKNQGIVKEISYNVFRHYQINDTNYWHIHGDAHAPASITLGYEHYSGYLQQMRNYVATGTGNAYKEKFVPLIERLKMRIVKNDSWLDVFFNNDVYIIGLTLGFVEIHLWWLLTYRQRAKLVQNIPIDNKIIYFYPSSFAKEIKNKIELLKSYGIIPYSIKGDPDRAAYYSEIINKIKSGII